MFAYVCIHDPEAYLRETMKVGIQGSCDVKVGPGLPVDADREVHPVVAADEDALHCWLSDLNAECEVECAHLVDRPGDTRWCGRFADVRRRAPDQASRQAG